MTTQQSVTSEPIKRGRAILEIMENGVALVRLGHPEERVVTFTSERMSSLREIVKHLRQSRPVGVVFTGPSLEMFTVGADIKAIGNVTDPEVGAKLAKEGQDVFAEIEKLPCPTVAAIGGPCVGGGCELVLACRFRIISDSKSSIIGLPEVKLGILPGFGGTQRLPRLIGVVRALDIILGGKTLRPKQALSAGLVNEIVSSHSLIDRAKKIASGAASVPQRKLPFKDRILTFNKFARGYVKGKAKREVLRESKGFYPAPLSALDSVFLGLDQGLATGYVYEAKELGRLIVTPESKSLVRLFFLTEKAKEFGKQARKDVEHVHALVIGAGAMGAGIAGVLSRNECSVILRDTTEDALGRGVSHIRSYISTLKYLNETERSFILNRVEATTRESPNLGNVTFAIEAIFEDLNLKKKVLSEAAASISDDAILATNTSSLSVSEIAKSLPRPERVIGMHFFNPVEKMPLVEIIMGERTSPKAIAVVAALATKLGKFPIVVRDVPGFLVNRILTPYLNEAAELVSEGYSVHDIDAAATGFGLPMGPIRLLDEVGLDVAMHVSEIMVKGYGERMRGPGLAAKLVEKGRKGKKSGAGFYDFSSDQSSPALNIRELLGITIPEKQVSDLKRISERLIMRLVNEAVLCLDEGVAGHPGPDAVNQIDLGSVMGFGFPPFRGGLLYFADSLGIKQVKETLDKLTKDHGPRFTPSPGIIKRAERGERFS